MSWESIERFSWLAGIFSAVVALVAAVLAARTAKASSRDFVKVLALATDKPELLAEFEAEERRRDEALRKRLRAVTAAAGAAVVLILSAYAIGRLLPDRAAVEVVGGDRPRTADQCFQLNDSTVCQQVHRYELAAGGKVETRFAAVDRRGPRDGVARLSVAQRGCAAAVRWRVTVDGVAVGAGEPIERVEFPLVSGREFVFAAERGPGGDCARVELDVDAWMSFDG
ncbi:hypothetical protein AB0A74_11010 [Saccharothrix sp. NPDC042600]|uniref:hypothetical protein n=1 Tax=Saccharothrix TaxID=2071 RepID=UPI0033F768F7|nr:hypothetical protein GCM10017745_09520 [Saccharothrix mutabilis subsp. capreolus]